MSSTSKKPLLVSIVGPTAVGKTTLSIAIAKHFSAHIISADSRQMYKHISIGTAKPSKEEQAGVPHHFIDFLELDEEYSAGRFEADALRLIKEELKDEQVIILVGGSGLYVKALLEGLDDVPKDEKIRVELNTQFKTEGLEPLLEELREVDQVSYERIDQKNPQRVIRALEVYRTSGKPFSSFHARQVKERPFESLVIGLNREREELKERIAQRCDRMLNEGWVEEAKTVFDKRHLNSLNTVGYKQLFEMMEKGLSLEETRDMIVQETQRFAKRQMTWFKRTTGVQWMDLASEGLSEQVIQRINHAIGS